MRIKSRGGFTGGRRRQGGWLGAAIGLITTFLGNKKAKKQAKADAAAREAEQAAKDPYAPYRDAAAQKLNALTYDTVKDTPEYKFRQESAARLMAAQGYTGSGNAIAAAAEAGGASYQQAFDNLARQAGIDVAPGGGHNAAADATVGANRMDQYSSMANSLTYGVGQIVDAFNKPAQPSGGP